MPKLNYWAPGDHNAICDICGRGFKFSELRKAWDGSYRDDACWEVYHPQNLVKAVKDNPSVPVARPRFVAMTTSNLAGNLTATATTFTITTGDGANFPTTYPYYMSLSQAGTTSESSSKIEELVKVTNLTGDTFTVVRGIGWPSQSWLTGDLVILGSQNPVVSL